MKKIKVALIEDDEILSKVIGEELSEAGFQVVRALDGEKGLAVVKAELPDLVLLDLVMPGMHGFDVLTEMKKSFATQNIPVLVLTMLGSDDDLKKGFELGANDYIVKSQHAVGEIVDKVKEFFSKESHPMAKQPKVIKGAGLEEVGSGE